MLKSLIAILSTVFIFLFSFFMPPIGFDLSAPTEVTAGSEFTVVLTIKKGEVEGFARFHQSLPDGFSAELIDAATGDFKSEKQTITFFWLILPNTETMTISYKIKIDNNVSGEFDLNGIFSYIDGDKKYEEMPLYHIIVLPSPNADALASDSSKIHMDLPPKIICQRKSIQKNENGEIEVQLLVNRGDLSKDQFAKIQENIPEGYDVQTIETQGGIFTFQNNVAKFLWMTLPPDQEFVVSYKLTPKEGVKIEDLNLTGDFSYLVDGKTVNVVTNQANGASVQDLLAKQGTAKTENPISSVDQTPDNKTNIEENNITTSVDAKTEKENITTSVTSVPDPAKSLVFYKVQISAGHKMIPVKSYFQKRKIKEPVSTEMLQGWYKYTIGNYSEYIKARDKRNKVWGTTPIKDAFVTAYNSGQRITVQEALMISNQTWYQ